MDNDTNGEATNATSALRQTIENTEQSLLGTEKHAALEKTENALHSTLGPYTDWYLFGGALVLISLIAWAIYFFKKKKR